MQILDKYWCFVLIHHKIDFVEALNGSIIVEIVSEVFRPNFSKFMFVFVQTF